MEHQGLPDHDATGRCAPASPIDAAQVLEDAADLLLIHGRSLTRAFGDDGSLCVVAAMTRSSGVNYEAYRVADHALTAHLAQHGLGRFSMYWNQAVEDDDVVRDTLLLVAKELRNTAVPV